VLVPLGDTAEALVEEEEPPEDAEEGVELVLVST